MRKETLSETDSRPFTSAPRRGSGFASENEEVAGALRGAPQSLQTSRQVRLSIRKLAKILLTAFAAIQQISAQMTFGCVGIE